MNTEPQSNSDASIRQAIAKQPTVIFSDRRNSDVSRKSPGLERRQFSDSHDSLSSDAAELGRAIDQYKLVNRRRYVSYEELLSIVRALGYEKTEE